MLKVIGIGDNVVDIYLDDGVMYPGGNALNFSVYAKQLGAEAAYLGVLGNDTAGTHIRQTLDGIGVDTSHCRYYQGENGYAEVSLVGGDRVFTGGNGGGVSREHPIHLRDEDFFYIQHFHVIHSSCYSYMEENLPRLRQLGIPISFDFSDHFDEAYLSKICPAIDVCCLSCSHLDEQTIAKLLRTIYQRYECQLVLSTMGSRGAMLYTGKQFYTQEPNFVEPVDTLGAGDAFITAFLVNYLSQFRPQAVSADQSEDAIIRESLAKGAGFAAETCRIRGAFGYGKPLQGGEAGAR